MFALFPYYSNNKKKVLIMASYQHFKLIILKNLIFDVLHLYICCAMILLSNTCTKQKRHFFSTFYKNLNKK